MTRSPFDIDLAPYIEHSLLHPAALPPQVDQCCTEADRFGFPVVCLYPVAVRRAVERLHQRPVTVCAVIGFPSGATTPAAKLYEAQEAVEHGARELDVMINLGLLKGGESEALYREMAQICEAAQVPVKAILETAILTDTEKRLGAEICMDAGVRYLKTSTGWFGGATPQDVKLLAQITKGRIGVKASGGIHTLEQAIALIEAGANRLGTSYGPALLQEQAERGRSSSPEGEA